MSGQCRAAARPSRPPAANRLLTGLRSNNICQKLSAAAEQRLLPAVHAEHAPLMECLLAGFARIARDVGASYAARPGNGSSIASASLANALGAC